MEQVRDTVIEILTARGVYDPALVDDLTGALMACVAATLDARILHIREAAERFAEQGEQAVADALDEQALKLLFEAVQCRLRHRAGLLMMVTDSTAASPSFRRRMADDLNRIAASVPGGS